MLPFEWILILTVGLSLLLACLDCPRWFWWIVAGLTLATLTLHIVVEGPRFHLLPAYLVAGLLTLAAFRRLARRTAMERTALRPAPALAGIFLLALAATLGAAFPVFHLPDPSGPYAVGFHYFHWTDSNRLDPFLAKDPRARELLVKVYYPAQPDPARSPAPYFNGSAELVRLFISGYNLPYPLFQHLSRVPTLSTEGLAVSADQPTYPVVLFLHGAGTSLEVHTAQCQDLASRGYIVAAIDHPYVSAGTVFPDHTVSHHQATTDFATPEPAEIITQIMADDARFVLDQLTALNAGTGDSSLAGRVDLERVGVAGHSVGGAAAYHLALFEPRIRAAVNLDGVVYIAPAPGKTPAPVLVLANDRYHVQAIQIGQPLMPDPHQVPVEERAGFFAIYGGESAYQAAYDRAQHNSHSLARLLSQTGTLYTITGSDHMKFADIGLYLGSRRLRELVQIGGATDPARCLEISSALMSAFFDQHLQGAPAEILANLPTRYPELHPVSVP